jgi:hypothetical protein
MALAYEKQQGMHLNNPRFSSPNKWSPWGTYTPHKENYSLVFCPRRLGRPQRLVSKTSRWAARGG